MNTKCPRCGSKYDIEPNEVGCMARCEVCGQSFLVDVCRFSYYIVSLFSYSGRIWRREYLKKLAMVAVPVAVMLAIGVIVDPVETDMFLMCLWILPTVMFCILAAPVSIRRLHDIGLSGSWYSIIVGIALIPFFGIVGFLILSCIPGTRGINRYEYYNGMTPWRKLKEYFTSLREGWLSVCKGRARRKEFLIIQGICLIVFLLIDGIFSSKLVTSITPFAGCVGSVANLALSIYALSVKVRRAHDLNRSGWWLLVNEGTAVACLMLGKGVFAGIMPLLIGLAWLIVLGSLDGTPGDNDYGSDPKGRVVTGEWIDTSKRTLWILTAVSGIIAIAAITVQSSDTEGLIESKPEFSDVRDLKDVVTRKSDQIRNDCLYIYSGYGLKIKQVIDEGVLVGHEDWRENEQDIFIKMNTEDLVDEDSLPPVAVKYIGILRYKTVVGAKRSVRAFKIVKKYEISLE